MDSWLNRRAAARRKADAADGRQPIVEFYRDECNSEPFGKRLTEWHAEWGNYELLERHHSFIQWLFPTRTPSMVNGAVAPLSDADVAAMKADVDIGKRLIKSYRMLLDFYGMVLVDEKTGEVARSPDYKDRYYWTLERSWHNHLRVCRILSCFSALGFRRYKVPLVRHLEREMGFAKGQSASAPKAISLPLRVINMFRTYIREDSRDYLKYSGVRLPGDHTDHVYLQQLDERDDADADTEPDTDAGADADADLAGAGAGGGGGGGGGSGAAPPEATPEDGAGDGIAAAAASVSVSVAVPEPDPVSAPSSSDPLDTTAPSTTDSPALPPAAAPSPPPPAPTDVSDASSLPAGPSLHLQATVDEDGDSNLA